MIGNNFLCEPSPAESGSLMSCRVEKAAPVETVNSLSWGGWDWSGATSLRPLEPSDILRSIVIMLG